MSHLDTTARQLGGDVACRQRLQIVCPGPGHSPKDRSLSVFLDPNSPDGFRVHCHAPGDDWRQARDHVRERLGIAVSTTSKSLPRTSTTSTPITPTTDRTAPAMAIWREAAAECSARWTAAGREVHRLVPRQVGADFNDLVEVL
jgi:hypothetical protein